MRAGTGQPGAGVDNGRGLATIGQVVAFGFRNQRPDCVLGLDDNVCDHVGPFPIDALNRRQRQLSPQMYAGDLRRHQSRLPRQPEVERRTQNDGVRSSRVRNTFQRSAC